jgi:hypothetical protein
MGVFRLMSGAPFTAIPVFRTVLSRQCVINSASAFSLKSLAIIDAAHFNRCHSGCAAAAEEYGWRDRSPDESAGRSRWKP